MGVLEAAYARRDARPAPRRIDYERMNRIFPRQKAALTRAKKKVQLARNGVDPYLSNSGQNVALNEAREALAALCKRTVAEWDEIGAWPDDWNLWQIALDDALDWRNRLDLRDL